MIYCKVLDKQFADKKAMFKELMERQGEIIELKKAAIKTTDSCAAFIKASTEKSEARTELKFGDTISAVINTTNYLDSHDDVHMASVWNKSIQEQQGKVYHVVDHDLKIGKIVGYPKDVVMELRTLPWSELGYNAEGMTTALIFNTKMSDKTNQDVFKGYRDGEPLQHSIRMQYEKIAFACNDPEYKEAYALFTSLLPSIVNKDKVEENGYFFAVYEAKIYKEGSTVIFGSNDITPLLPNTTTQETQPQKSTEQAKPIDFVAMCKQANIYKS